MELEGLLLYSQELATGPCSEPDKSIPHLPTLYLYVLFILFPSYPMKWQGWLKKIFIGKFN